MGKAMPTGQGTDFDIWVKDAAIIFSEYPEQDVRILVEHPVKGIRSKFKWLPQPSDLIEFLNEMRNRRGRIISNAKHVISEKSKLVEIEETPEQRASMGRKVENLARELAGKRSLDDVEKLRAENIAFNKKCIEAGGGSYQVGLMILLEQGN